MGWTTSFTTLIMVFSNQSKKKSMVIIVYKIISEVSSVDMFVYHDKGLSVSFYQHRNVKSHPHQ